jgi:hypothetical protein
LIEVASAVIISAEIDRWSYTNAQMISNDWDQQHDIYETFSFWKCWWELTIHKENQLSVEISDWISLDILKFILGIIWSKISTIWKNNLVKIK